MRDSPRAAARVPWHIDRERMAKGVVIFIALLAAAGAGAAWRMHAADAAVPAEKTAAHKPKPIPVQSADVRRTDVPVSLSALATVQPLNVVTVRSRVDGAVNKIAFEEGQMVKEGDLLALIDPRPYQASLDQAKAKQAQDEATLANAQRDLARYAQLAQSNYASRQQLDNQKATVAQLTAQIDGDKAAVESAQVQLDYTTIKAPMAGRTGFRLVDQGNLVRATDATGIVTLSQITPITAVLTIPERNFGDVSAAEKAGKVPAIAYAPDGKELARGELSVLNSQIDQATGTFKAKATFANTEGALWPGQSISVKIMISTMKDVVAVSEDALLRSPDGYYAFVIKDDGTVERRQLKIVRQAENTAVIGSGLSSGEKVVVAGGSRLSDGVTVDATPAAQGVADAERDHEGSGVSQ